MDDLAIYRQRRVIVFGSTGFIGRWVARCLSIQKAHLYLFFRDPALADSVFSRYCIRGKPIQLDLTDSNQIQTEIKAIQPDIIFNLAGYGVDRSEKDEVQAYRINAELVESICKALDGNQSLDWSGQRLVHVGSALEYGEAHGDLSENSEAYPTTLYGRSKLAGTMKLKTFCQSRQLPGLTARLFTVYGYGEHPGRLLPSLMEIARTGETLALTDGLQQRDFTYVEDVAEGLLRLGLCRPDPGVIVNLATGRLTTVRKFVEIASEILSIHADQLNFGALPTRASEMKHSPIKISRMVEYTSWQPPTELDTGIRKTWQLEQEL